MMQVKVISFNIRSVDDENNHTIRERAPRLATITGKYDADIIGFQEFTPPWEEYIEAYYFDKYAFFNKYRTDQGWIESPPILWKKDKFECLERGYFWLSDTPEIMSGGWDDFGHNRICLYVILRDKHSKKAFVCFNTHLGFGVENQVKSVQLIHRYTEKLSGYPIVITGDFNMCFSSIPYFEMIKKFDDANELTAKDRRATYHGYHPQDNLDAHIDYCFISKEIQPIRFQLIDELIDDKFPSDHYGLYMELEI